MCFKQLKTIHVNIFLSYFGFREVTWSRIGNRQRECLSQKKFKWALLLQLHRFIRRYYSSVNLSDGILWQTAPMKSLICFERITWCALIMILLSPHNGADCSRWHGLRCQEKKREERGEKKEKRDPPRLTPLPFYQSHPEQFRDSPCWPEFRCSRCQWVVGGLGVFSGMRTVAVAIGGWEGWGPFTVPR